MLKFKQQSLNKATLNYLVTGAISLDLKEEIQRYCFKIYSSLVSKLFMNHSSLKSDGIKNWRSTFFFMTLLVFTHVGNTDEIIESRINTEVITDSSINTDRS